MPLHSVSGSRFVEAARGVNRFHGENEPIRPKYHQQENAPFIPHSHRMWQEKQFRHFISKPIWTRIALSGQAYALMGRKPVESALDGPIDRWYKQAIISADFRLPAMRPDRQRGWIRHHGVEYDPRAVWYTGTDAGQAIIKSQPCALTGTSTA